MSSGDNPNPVHKQIIKARHDLRNPLAHILGFSEMLAEHAQRIRRDDLRADSLALNQAAGQILAAVNLALDIPRLESGQSDIPALHENVRSLAVQIVTGSEAAETKFAGLNDEVIHNDLDRIAGSARQLIALADSALPALRQALP